MSIDQSVYLQLLEKSGEAKSFQFALNSEEQLRPLLESKILKKTATNIIIDFARLDCARLAYLLLNEEYQEPTFRSIPEIAESLRGYS